MNSNQKQTVAVKCLLLLGAATLAAFVLFFVWQRSEYTMWQYDSEGLVLGRMYQMQTGQDGGNPAGLLGGFDLPQGQNHGDACAYDQLGYYYDDMPVSAEQYWTYQHQSGLQGTAWGVFNRVLCLLRLQAQTRLSVMRIASAWLFCLMAALLAVWLWQEWGKAAAVFGTAGLLLSSWTLRAAVNLYWQLWLYFLPFVLGLFLCRRAEKRGKLPWQSCMLLGGSVFLRFLCGFEFTSSVLILLEIPVLYYFIKHWQRGALGAKQCKKWFAAAVWTGAAGLAAFVLAIGVWFAQLSIQLGGARAAVAEMLVPIVSRTGVGGTAQGAAAEQLSTSLSTLLRRYLLEDTVLPGISMAGLLLICFAAFCIVLCVCAAQKNIVALSGQLRKFAVVCVAMLAPLSWFILARGHAAAHPHIDYLLWLLPVVPLCCAQVGSCVQALYTTLKHMKEESAL